MTDHDDRVYLNHIVDAAREIIAFSSERARSDLNTDRLYVLGMTRLVEIIGEAATRLSDATRLKIKDIPWPQIISARNRLIHGYDKIDLDILWNIIILDIPPLIERLENFMHEED